MSSSQRRRPVVTSPRTHPRSPFSLSCCFKAQKKKAGCSSAPPPPLTTVATAATWATVECPSERPCCHRPTKRRLLKTATTTVCCSMDRHSSNRQLQWLTPTAATPVWDTWKYLISHLSSLEASRHVSRRRQRFQSTRQRPGCSCRVRPLTRGSCTRNLIRVSELQSWLFSNRAGKTCKVGYYLDC